MLHETLGAPEGSRSLPEFDMRAGGDCGSLAALHADRQHATEATLHLSCGDGMPWKIRKPWIEHRRNVRICAQAFGERLRILRSGAHAGEQRAHTPQKQPRFERTKD